MDDRSTSFDIDLHRRYDMHDHCKMVRKINGILFDFDGVVVDSEKTWFDIAISTLKKMNIQYDKSIKQKATIGIISKDLFRMLILDKSFDVAKIQKTYQRQLKQTFQSHSPKVYPYLKKFLQSTDLKVGLVSNAHRSYLLHTLKQNELLSYFRGNITSCTGSIRHKPFKDGYIIGAQKLGLKPSEVLVIEDSDVGIEAALNAKVQKVLRHTNHDKNLPTKIKHRVPKLLSYKDFDKRLKRLK